MVVDTAVIERSTEDQVEEPAITRAKIATWVDEYVELGKEPEEAAVLVLADIKQKNLIDELLKMVGVRIVLDAWRHRQIAIRAEVVDRIMAPPALPNAPSDGSRVHDLTALRQDVTLYETPIYVGGKGWTTVGELNGKLRKLAAAERRKNANTESQWATFLLAMDTLIGDDEQTIALGVPDLAVAERIFRQSLPTRKGAKKI